MLAVASMLKGDRSEAEQLLAQQVEALSGRIDKLEEEHGDLRVEDKLQDEGVRSKVGYGRRPNRRQ